jgi:RNA-directed DNA polymerase
MGEWKEICDSLNRLLRGWCGYFSPGSHYATDRVIEAHVYDRVRNFLARRHKMPARAIGPFRMDAVFREHGVLKPRQCRRAGATS